MKSAEEVRGFKYMTKRNSIAAFIDIVEVIDDAGQLSCLQSILGILQKTKKISCLTLKYSFPPPLHRLPAAHEVVFHNLTCLNVNAPHGVVAPFLLTHPNITDLTLGSCGAPSCALIGSPLPFVQSLACPPGCVQGLISAGSHLTRLSSIHRVAEDAILSINHLLNFRTIPTWRILTVLDISFVHSTTELLQRISAAAPALINLRLSESFSSPEVRDSVFDTDDCFL
jgi:hypothetical protein